MTGPRPGTFRAGDDDTASGYRNRARACMELGKQSGDRWQAEMAMRGAEVCALLAISAALVPPPAGTAPRGPR